MKIHVINTGNFKLDGGAMFGVVPKTLWSRTNPADENNMCSWAMRCLLLETENKKILIDTGIGNKQSEKFFQYFYLHGDDDLLKSLSKINISAKEITHVFFTHLHFFITWVQNLFGIMLMLTSSGNGSITSLLLSRGLSFIFSFKTLLKILQSC